jgi:DNA-binding MarR family transcriptional regulator
LYAATRAVTRRYTDLLAEVHLTYPQYLAMLALWEADRPLTVGEVGDRLRLDSGTLTPVLKRLESAGFVARRRDSADERRVLVEVTREGEALQARVADVPDKIWASMGLPPADGERLRGLLNQLMDGLDESATA